MRKLFMHRQYEIVVTLFLITAAFLSRFLPHPMNFTPVLAIALLAGARIQNVWLRLAALFLPILVSDALLGFHATIPFIYASYFLILMLGSRIAQKSQTSGALAMQGVILGLGGSVLFFIISNFGVWLVSGMYTADWSGFIGCYTNAIPFFRNTLISTLIYTQLLFHLHALALLFQQREISGQVSN